MAKDKYIRKWANKRRAKPKVSKHRKAFNHLASHTLSCSVSELESLLYQVCHVDNKDEMKIQNIENEKFVISFGQKDDEKVMLENLNQSRICISSKKTSGYHFKRIYRYLKKEKRWKFESETVEKNRIMDIKKGSPEEITVKWEHDNVHIQIRYDEERKTLMHFKDNPKFNPDVYILKKEGWYQDFCLIPQKENAYEIYKQLKEHPFFCFPDIVIRTIDNKENIVTTFEKTGEVEKLDIESVDASW